MTGRDDGASDRGPGVRVPPPAIFAVAFLTGLGLDFLWRTDFLPVIWAALTGISLFAAGLGLVVWCAVIFHREETAIEPWRPASRLVSRGPFALSRNPIYVGLTLIYLGAAIGLGLWWALATLVPALVVLDRYVIRREEAYLQERFGETYQAYRQRVRRWL